MITAQQARELAWPTIEEICESISPYIEATARDGKRVLGYHNRPLEDEAYKNSSRWTEFVNKMKEYGYTVKFIYEERQFVNMYIQISW